MSSHRITRRTAQCATALGIGLLCIQPSAAIADEGEPDGAASEQRIRGITVTGTNSVLGKPIFSWGGSFGSFNFPTLFVYNETGTQPLPIDEHTPDSAILASGVSPDYLLSRGVEIQPEWINVPLRQVPVLVDFANIRKLPLRGLLEADPLELSQSEPANHVTLGQWMSASGDLKIDCSGEGANLKLEMRSLLPNRIYSVWGTMRLPPELPAPGEELTSTSFPLPIGGTPNIFVTDQRGDATFERWIKFCPLGAQSEDVPSMLTLEVQYHANHHTYGAVPLPGLIPGNWHGVIQFSHVVFPINVTLLDN